MKFCWTLSNQLENNMDVVDVDGSCTHTVQYIEMPV